jgi:hypothetical protein
MTYRLLGRLGDARVQAESSLSLANELSSTFYVTQATKTLGLITRDECDLKSAAAQLRHALALALVPADVGSLLTGQFCLELAKVFFDAHHIANAADMLLIAKNISPNAEHANTSNARRTWPSNIR